MNSLNHKIDFAAIFSVHNANPNGDPLNGNRPRENYDGHGEISDVCIKRKLRNRLQDFGTHIFVKSDDRADDGFQSLQGRLNSIEKLKDEKDRNVFSQVACETWLDVRSFGQVFAFKGSDMSVGVRGPVTVQSAFSVLPIDINSMQITKSVNSVPDDKKTSDTMGSKHCVPFALYVTHGSINCQLAEKTGFSEEDAQAIHKALLSLFENDASSARPEGSMEVVKVIWWEHNCKSGQYSSAKVHRALHVVARAGVEEPHCVEDYEITVDPLEGLIPQIENGI
ncbi:MAG: type I-C CRISPR-associated protein Cas7/Csd2 [Clostridia bacterium]